MSEPRKNDQPRQRAWGLSLILLLPLMCGVIYGASQLGAFQAPAGLLVGQVTPIETADYQAWNEIVFAPVDDGLLTQIAAEANGEVLEIAGVATARPTVARDEPVGIPMVFSATDVRDATPQSIVAIANVTGDDNSTSSDDDGDTQSDNDTSASAGNGSTTRGAGISADDIFVEATEGSVAVAQAPTEFIAPSDTPMPTDAPTETPRPSETPVPTDMDTVTPAPTNTLAPTNTPIPTNTAVPAPRINFAASPQSGDAPLTVNFTDLSGGAITSYSWSFGDGTTSTLASPTHTYSTAGDYYVRFEVTGPGGTVAAGVTISVGNPVPDTPIPPTPVPDSDGDGILDANDVCPNTGNQGFGVDGVGCPNPTPAPDTDGDGFNDDVDICPNLADFGFGMNPDAPGCPNPTPVPDSDGDGFNDSVDACPNQGDAGFGVDGTGCPNPAPPPPDRDNDGVPDATDACPDDGDAGFGVDGTGCPNPPPPPPDRDNDGVPDATDACPDDGDAGFGVDGTGCPNPPPPPPPPTVAVNSVTIIDTDDNSVQGSITNGATVTLDLSQNLALRAEATGVGSVQFYIDGNLIQTENAAPYSIAGDGGPGNLTNWNFAPGTYTLEVRPYPQSNGQGTVGTSLTATITIP